MFELEAQMTPHAESWLASKGFVVRREYEAPWGVCDLVGVSANRHHVRKRLRQGQKNPIGTPLRVAIYSRILRCSNARVSSLSKAYSRYVSSEQILNEIELLRRGGYVECLSGGKLRAIDGWVPLQKRIVAIELKLSRVREALDQATSHLQFADESYVGLPMETARNVACGKRRAWFEERGVGVLGVAPGCCRRIVVSRPTLSPDDLAQMQCVERFWRSIR